MLRRVIAMIDYGSGNLRSVHKALRYLEADVRLVTRPTQMKDARAVVLPGVGAFDDCLNALQKQDLLEACRDFIKSGRLFLGICVGSRPCSRRARSLIAARRDWEFSRERLCVLPKSRD